MNQIAQKFFKNKLILCALLFLLLMTLSTVSASENGTDESNVMDIPGFNNLSDKINNTDDTVTLDSDYEYKNGTDKEIVISKPVTIDGSGHTIDAKKSSRIFNVTADNVVIKNIRFVNGNALGNYFRSDVGGGAIYWSGANGILENCTFINNTGSGIEDDPFDKEEIIVNEDGSITHIYRFRPMGARINQGGAILWEGDNGTVVDCGFNHNDVGYPNGGGAICWRGNDGKIIGSSFVDNGGWTGSAVEWRGANGSIFSSKFMNWGISDNGIFWAGENGTIRNSILISPDGRRVVHSYSDSLDANYNYWGDSIDNPDQYLKPDDVEYWYASESNVTSFEDLELNSSFVLVKSTEKISEKIISSDLKVYYNSNGKFNIQVYDKHGKPAIFEDVKFYINNHEYSFMTDDNGIATLKIKEKPGKYTIFSQYGDVIVKNKITVKSVLITKNLSKKVKKSAKFNVKVLNSKGKAYKNQVVKIKFKSKTYKIKTNKKGIAAFKVSKKLRVGKYVIKTTYKGLTNSNKIVVKK